MSIIRTVTPIIEGISNAAAANAAAAADVAAAAAMRAATEATRITDAIARATIQEQHAQQGNEIPPLSVLALRSLRQRHNS